MIRCLHIFPLGIRKLSNFRHFFRFNEQSHLSSILLFIFIFKRLKPCLQFHSFCFRSLIKIGLLLIYQHFESLRFESFLCGTHFLYFVCLFFLLHLCPSFICFCLGWLRWGQGCKVFSDEGLSIFL